MIGGALMSAKSLPTADELRDLATRALDRCGVDTASMRAGATSRTPVLGSELLPVPWSTPEDVDRAVEAAHEAFLTWRVTPAPLRGALVKRLGELLREHLDDLADLVSLEVGKIRSEARGEVQEMVDICDFAVGLSRQLYGRTMPSERPGHRLMETWHPLGVVGVISAFNFPVAVWSWNAAVALVCGDPVVWKPSELTPLTALACTALLERAAGDVGAPDGLGQLVLGDASVAELLVDHPLVPLVSATGSVRMGRAVGPRVAARFGQSLLELGGNNATVVTSSADLDLAVRGIVFAGAGTAGQRCTTLRRLIVHESVVDPLLDKVVAAYQRLPVGDPFDATTLVGPLVNEKAYVAMQGALDDVRADGGEVLVGGERRLAEAAPGAYYVTPAVARAAKQGDVVRRETFAPLLHVLSYTDLDEAIALQNGVPQGLSSSIFTGDQAEAERFLAADGADCGIVNVNIGTSGAEIGGAFGGQKETGGGRESGSDSWKAYMRRATNTVNYSGELPLAQGVDFTV
jgi:aldehyde dehydrogenase (NAD+)